MEGPGLVSQNPSARRGIREKGEATPLSFHCINVARRIPTSENLVARVFALYPWFIEKGSGNFEHFFECQVLFLVPQSLGQQFIGV